MDCLIQRNFPWLSLTIMVVIKIQDLAFHSYHGVHATERKVGGKYVVQIEMRASVEESFETDNLSDTIDYAAVAKRVEHIMNLPQNLIEKVAADIANALLNFDSRIDGITVTVEKLKPPIHQELRSTAVTITKDR